MKLKNKKTNFLTYKLLLGTLAAMILGNRLSGEGTIWAGKGTIKSEQDFETEKFQTC